MTQVKHQSLPSPECRRRGLDLGSVVRSTLVAGAPSGRVIGYDHVGDPVVEYADDGRQQAYYPCDLELVLTEKPAANEVDHPAHYGGADNPYEAIKVIEAWDLGFCLGNTVKYIARAGKKSGTEELVDLRKARWYLDREITRREAEKRATSATNEQEPG